MNLVPTLNYQHPIITEIQLSELLHHAIHEHPSETKSVVQQNS